MRTVVKSWATAQGKARALSSEAEKDANNPILAPVLDEQLGRIGAIGSAVSPALKAERIHAFVRDCIRYVRDPLMPGAPGGPERRREQFADAGVVLRRGFDDCDGKARLVCALALRAGLQARMRDVFHLGDFTHVQAELRWPGSERHRCARNGWVISETILRGVQLGQGAEAALRDHYGRPVYS